MTKDGSPDSVRKGSWFTVIFGSRTLTESAVSSGVFTVFLIAGLMLPEDSKTRVPLTLVIGVFILLSVVSLLANLWKRYRSGCSSNGPEPSDVKE